MARGDSPSDRQTVLVIEDDPDVLQSTALLLETLGFEVLEAHDGGAALAALDRHGAIDLLFVDFVLARGARGGDIARQALAKHPGLKILLTTGRPELVEDQEFPVLLKPFRLSELQQEISELLGP